MKPRPCAAACFGPLVHACTKDGVYWIHADAVASEPRKCKASPKWRVLVGPLTFIRTALGPNLTTTVISDNR